MTVEPTRTQTRRVALALTFLGVVWLVVMIVMASCPPPTSQLSRAASLTTERAAVLLPTTFLFGAGVVLWGGRWRRRLAVLFAMLACSWAGWGLVARFDLGEGTVLACAHAVAYEGVWPVAVLLAFVAWLSEESR